MLVARRVFQNVSCRQITRLNKVATRPTNRPFSLSHQPWPSSLSPRRAGFLHETTQKLRFNSSSAIVAGNGTSPAGGYITDLTDAEQQGVIEQLAHSWGPPLETVPTGWSNTWADWDNIMTFFHPSPYFLMLPQVEMIMNIKYGLKGTMVPVFFSNEKNASIFRLENPPGGVSTENEKYFYVDIGNDKPVSILEEVHNSVDLVRMLEAQGVTGELSRTALSPHPEGTSTLDRILERDLSVIPIASEFLGYTPAVTEPIEELPSAILEAKNIVVDERALLRLKIRALLEEFPNISLEEIAAEEVEEVIHGLADLISEVQERGLQDELVQAVKFFIDRALGVGRGEENGGNQEDDESDNDLDEDDGDMEEEIRRLQERLQDLINPLDDIKAP